MMEDLFQKVKERIKVDVKKPSSANSVHIPSNMMFKCPRCQHVEFMEDFERDKKVCGNCGYYKGREVVETE